MSILKLLFSKKNADTKKVINNRNQIMINILAIPSMVFYFCSFIYYIIYENYLFARINIGAILCTVIALVLCQLGKLTISSDILGITTIVYAVVSTCLSGWELGTQWYIMIVILTHYLFLESTQIRKMIYSFLGVISFNLIHMYLNLYDIKYPIENNYIIFINYNIFFIYLILVLNIYTITNMVLQDSYKKNLELAKEEAHIDPLTNISNRRYLEVIVHEINNALSKNRDVSVGILDIDDFKNVNDTHGHLFGDEVLKTLADEMKKAFRAEDALVRYGGEEFLIVMYNVNEDVAFKIMDRFRTIIQDKIVSHHNLSASITFTCGIANVKREHNFEAALEKADKRLYYGKTTGKNKVVLKCPKKDK